MLVVVVVNNGYSMVVVVVVVVLRVNTVRCIAGTVGGPSRGESWLSDRVVVVVKGD